MGTKIKSEAEKLFEKTLSDYNSTASIFDRIELSSVETEMFVMMMHKYHNDRLLVEKQTINIGDRITDGTHIAIVETQPTIKADITWLHNDAYVNDADLSNFKTEIE